MNETQFSRTEICFRCDHCSQEFSWESFRIAVVLYGVILLVSNPDEPMFVGIVCPNCIKTTMRAVSKSEFFRITEYLRKELYFECTFQDEERLVINSVKLLNKEELASNQSHMDELWSLGSLKYSSFEKWFLSCEEPFYFNSLRAQGMKPSIRGSIHEEFCEEIYEEIYNQSCEEIFESIYGCNIGIVKSIPNKNYLINQNEEGIRLLYYPPFCFEDSDFVGMYEIVFFFQLNKRNPKDDINKLTEIENQTGMAVFPRYVYQGQIRFSCDSYFYDYERFLVNPYVDDKVYQTLFNTRQIWLKDYEFIDTLHDENFLYSQKEAGAYKALWNVECLFKEKGIPETIDENVFRGYVSDQSEYKIMTMLEEIWDSFGKEYFRKIASVTSSDFAKDYLNLLKRIDCSDATINNLKFRYIQKIYDYLNNPSERRKAKKLFNVKRQNEAREAEKRFPGVKIISQDGRIADIEIDLVKIVEYETRPFVILLLGEKGTGKELFAQAIHEASGTSNGFYPVDCGAVSEDLFASEMFGAKAGSYSGATKDRKGLFSAAKDGTLFLDEIGNVGIQNQQKLLRVLSSHEVRPVGGTNSARVNPIIVFATNRDLKKMVAEGTFLGDLYDRIRIYELKIPPLRNRPNDIPLLIKHFIEKFDKAYLENPELTPIQINDEAIEILKVYDWPGNVRVLENIIRKIFTMRAGSRGEITSDELPEEIFEKKGKKKDPSAESKKRRNDKKLYSDDEINQALKNNDDNKTWAAKELGCSANTIFRRIREMEEKGRQTPTHD